MTRSAPGRLVLSALLCLSAGVSVASVQDKPSLSITSPGESAFVKGSTRLSAEVEPPGAATEVVFYADGRQICTVQRTPFSCEWDAGSIIAEHTIRVVANLLGGERIVRTVTTAALEAQFSSSVETVEVVATVTDGSRFVQGLNQSAFRIYEDDKPQQIVHFSSADAPLELVVAVDVSASLTAAMPDVKQAVRQFLAGKASDDRVTLLGFNQRIATLARRESNRTRLELSVDGLAASGNTALYDAVVYGLTQLDMQRGRRALVVFTDGQDEGSRAVLPLVESRLRKSDVSLYVIGQGRAMQNQSAQKLLRRLAEPTGGRAFFEDDMQGLNKAFAEIRAELSSQYLLGYVSTNEARDGSWRSIRVEVPGRYRVRAREGYTPSIGR